MPWKTDADVERHNKGLSAKQKKVWREVANSELESHGDDARAIKAANAAVARMKESMNFTPIQTIQEFWEAASKILHMDQSHDALRSKLQDHISAEHRKANAASDSASYYNTPYVRDVYGDESEGHVVHSKDGKMTMSKFKKQKDGTYMLHGHKQVKQAYVTCNEPDADDKKESLVVFIDGSERVLQESAQELTEVLELQEAAGAGKGKVTLISAGKGSMGYYTESALQKAAKDKIFPSGTQMFLNHQTKEERLSRPEGDITKLAAKTTSDAVYVAGESGKPGRLVANYESYPEYTPFLAARKDDIGVSVRVGASPSGKVQDGVPLVENMVYALSADFVTKAGRGGKIEEMYESYRATTRPIGGNQPQENSMTDQEKQQFQTLQESVARLTASQDRLLEQNVTLTAGNLLSEALRDSNLKPRGCDRVRTIVMANIPLTDQKTLDTAKFQEAVKKAINDEIAYLQESGVRPGPQIVRSQGGVVPMTDKDGKELSEAAVAENAEKIIEESLKGFISAGKEKSA